MKLFSLLLVLSLTTSTALAQWGDNYIKLSHNITTENKNITNFDKIEVSEDFEVYIHISEEGEKVEIEANENLHDKIIVKKEGSRLKISTKSYSTSYNSRKKKNGAQERLVAHITARNLSEISATEDVKITLEDKLYAENLTIDLDEDSTLAGSIEAQNLVVLLDEDSVVDIEGSAETMRLAAHEDSTIKGFYFKVGTLEAKLTEDSVAKLTVNGTIDLRAKEDSYFYYRGDGHFTRKHLTGDSEVKKR